MSEEFSTIARMGVNKKDDSGTTVGVVALLIFFCAVAWPYFLGTWVAVQFGADNPSTARAVTGWFFEVLWLGGLASLAIGPWVKKKRSEAQASRITLLKERRRRDFGQAGAELFDYAERAVGVIAASEAARTGWLGDPVDFDFGADLEMIADSLRRAEEIGTVTAEASSIRNFSESDKKMLGDAQREVTRLEKSARQRAKLIGECALEADGIDRVLRAERENVVMAERRAALRKRLGPILYGSSTTAADTPSESADAVTARAAAFHELKALLDRQRVESAGE